MMPYGYTRARRNSVTPGEPCPFAGGTCQEGCWAWSLEADGECAAFGWLEPGQSPRDLYEAAVIEADAL